MTNMMPTHVYLGMLILKTHAKWDNRTGPRAKNIS
jgi:hypothetical protein